nr:Protein ZC412.10 [Haemonchus contortus]
MYIGIISLLALVFITHSLPERPSFPTEELCDLYREKCETKLKKLNCKARAIECLDYANNGLRITWNFCNFLNNDNVTVCRERAITDYEIIKGAIMNDTFKYDFAD